jgi:hypothetical protein
MYTVTDPPPEANNYTLSILKGIKAIIYEYDIRTYEEHITI